MNRAINFSDFDQMCLSSGDDYEPYGYAEINEPDMPDYNLELDQIGYDNFDDDY